MQAMLPVLSNLHDPALHSALQAAMDNKTKPVGSLGRLEALAMQLGEILGTEKPVLSQPQMVVFAADHGLTAQGISAFQFTDYVTLYIMCHKHTRNASSQVTW